VNIFDDETYMLWRILNQARNAILKARQKELSAYNLSGRQASALLISQATDGKVTPYKYARWAVLERHTISELINRMEKQGLVRKVKKLDSRKSIGIELTEKGRESAELAGRCEPLHAIISSLSTEQRQQLYVISKILRDAAFKEIGVKAELPYPPF